MSTIKTPSIKTLRPLFGADARQAKRLLTATRAELLELSPAAAERDRVSWHPHKTFVLRLDALAELGHPHGFYGVEGMQLRHGERLEYLKAGDVYAPTIVYWRGNYSVRDIGSIIERHAP